MEKRKKDFYVELVLFLILGILIGVAVKMESVKRIAIGFDDYKMRIESQGYDINKLQADLLVKEAEMEKINNNETAPAEDGQTGQTLPENQELNNQK